MAIPSPSFVQISEPALLLRISVLHRPEMSAEELYDTTRGVWIIADAQRDKVSFALAVVGGTIKEVYEVHSWHQANTTTYTSGRTDVASPRYAKRWEFKGCIAAPTVRDRYLGQPVDHSGQNPVKYVNC